MVPVAADRGHTAGVLAFGSSNQRRFDDDDRRYIVAVVERARRRSHAPTLLEAEQRSRARLRTLLDVSERLAALDDPDRGPETIGALAATRIGRVTIVPRGSSNAAASRQTVAGARRHASLQPALQDRVDDGVAGAT